MIVAALTIGLFAIVATMLAKIVGDDAQKIAAALQGRSWIVEPPSPFAPVNVRYSARYPVNRPVRALPELRAAA